MYYGDMLIRSWGLSGAVKNATPRTASTTKTEQYKMMAGQPMCLHVAKIETPTAYTIRLQLYTHSRQFGVYQPRLLGFQAYTAGSVGSDVLSVQVIFKRLHSKVSCHK